jgi:hypothetical protein
MKKSSLYLALQTLLSACCMASGASLRKTQTIGNVVKLELINGLTGSKIRDLKNGTIIDMATIRGMIEPAFNVRAILSSGAPLVIFDFQSNKNYRYDDSNPYTLCAAAACPELTYGTYEIGATSYNSTTLQTAKAGNPFSVKFEIRKAPILPVTSLQLINTGVVPNKVVMNLTFNAINVIDLQKLRLSAAKFNINAVVNNTVKSVKFSNGWVEGVLPLAYCGNVGVVFNTCDDLTVKANMNISVIGYPLSGQKGTPYPLQWARIQIVQGTVLTPAPPAPVRAPTPTAPIPKLPTPTAPTSTASGPILTPTAPKAPVPAPVVTPTAPVPAQMSPVSTRPVSVPVAPVAPPPAMSTTCTIPKVSFTETYLHALNCSRFTRHNSYLTCYF